MAATLLLPFAIAAFGLCIYSVVATWNGDPTAASFTRVGGSTRVETALEASRFWTDAPDYVVKVRAHAGNDLMWLAARCAMRRDAPLLFEPEGLRDARRRYLVNTTTIEKRWPKTPDVLTAADLPNCVSGKSRVDRLSIVDVRSKSATSLRLPASVVREVRGDDLAPFVILAAAKGAQGPDIAIGLALAAHVAQSGEKVSLVIVPRYLQADRQAEKRLRAENKTVEGGIVLGERKILSDDSRNLLRQALEKRQRGSFSGAFGTALGPLQGLIVAFIALLAALFFGAKAAETSIAKAVEGRLEARGYIRPSDKEPAPIRSEGKDMTETVERTTGDKAPSLTSDLKGEVTLWLRSGPKVRGTRDPNGPIGALWLTRAALIGNGYEPDQEIGDVRLLDSEVSMIVFADPSVEAISPVRRAALRLVIDMIAELSDTPNNDPLSHPDDRVEEAIGRVETSAGTPTSRTSSKVRRLAEVARSAADIPLYEALGELEDSTKLMVQWKREGARGKVLDALKRVAHIGQTPVSWSALTSGHARSTDEDGTFPQLIDK